MHRSLALLLLVPSITLAQGAPKAADQKPAEQKAADQKPSVTAPASTPEAIALAERVQRFYEKTKDFSASFEQSYKYKAMNRVKKSSGTVQVKKPGMMRWDYEQPFPQQFVLDGKALYMYVPEDNQVQVKKDFSADTLSSAVTFLWGRGKLVDEFHVVQVARPDLGPTVLQLTPKRAQPGFTKLLFAVDEATGQVNKSVVFDTQGNENTIAFSNVKTNTGVADSRFQFQIPKGAVVKEL